MAHDFAKRRPYAGQSNSGYRTGNQKSASKKKSNSKNSGTWGSFFTGLMTGIFASCLLYLGVIRPIPINQQLQTEATIGNPSEQNDSEPTNFIFYQTLRDAEIAVNAEPIELKPVSMETVVPVKYRLQAGSFQSRADAEDRLVIILLSNLEAQVVPAVVSGKTWYRVQVGPFEKRSDVNAAIDELSINNIDTLVLLAK